MKARYDHSNDQNDAEEAADEGGKLSPFVDGHAK